MIITAKQYVEMSPLSFPLKLKSGYTITELVGECSGCGALLRDLRGEVKEYENCSDLRFAGFCQPCKTLVTCRFRRYRDGRFEEEHDGHWRILVKVTWWTRIEKLLFKLMGRIPWKS